jgi:hypothetical protein
MDSTPRTSARGRAAAALAAILVLALVVGATSKAQEPQTRDLLPDVQAAIPDHLSLYVHHSHVYFGFNSALINGGEGPLEIAGSRPNTSRSGMDAEQVVTRTDGSKYTARDAGSLRYVREPGHRYWHLDDVMAYELRTADTFDLVASKSRRGYCLRDGASFPHYCGRDQSSLLTLTMGVGPGRRSRWAPIAEGQSIDITRVPSGRYWLVSRADPRGHFVESDGSNDASGLLFDLTNRKTGRVRTLKVVTVGKCPTAERCDHPEGFAR